MFNLLTDELDNVKLSKSSESIWKVAGLSLAPHKMSGYNVCPYAGQCARFCVGEHAGFVIWAPNVKEARIVKTRQLFEQPELFLNCLVEDLERLEEIAWLEDRKPACRLNTFSDLSWEELFPWIFERFPTIQFYDYTKNLERYYRFLAKDFPSNYHLTYSYSEKTPVGTVDKILQLNGNIAVAIATHVKAKAKLPNRYWGYPTIDGDRIDLRFLDNPRHIVLLRAKGNLLTTPNKFVQSFAV